MSDVKQWGDWEPARNGEDRLDSAAYAEYCTRQVHKWQNRIRESRVWANCREKGHKIAEPNDGFIAKCEKCGMYFQRRRLYTGEP